LLLRLLTVSFLDHFRVVMFDRAAGDRAEHGMVMGEMFPHRRRPPRR
jgi:hypothetical protein